LNTTSKTFGYARVSTLGQSTDHQEAALQQAGCNKIYLEKFTGTKANRPKLNELREQLRQGDTVVVTKLDRLGRSTKDLLQIVTEFEQQGVNFVVLEQNINTSTPDGRLFFTLISAFAQFEAEIIASRTRDGLAAAKAAGKLGGRKPVLSQAQSIELMKYYLNGTPVQKIAEIFGVTRQVVYRAIEKQSSKKT
jgi:DNA invertase Pin-like site-specific DNA recombinase